MKQGEMMRAGDVVKSRQLRQKQPEDVLDSEGDVPLTAQGCRDTALRPPQPEPQLEVPSGLWEGQRRGPERFSCFRGFSLWRPVLDLGGRLTCPASAEEEQGHRCVLSLA